ncbi:MAG: RNA 2',3'-cyclic phosphodiesterase [Candidatus Woesearchaeota archaeon]|nr:MAG: RNA 2',3'-cyclic phosphodiesterase [Candidatus Woesearchaeota archaeon]
MRLFIAIPLSECIKENAMLIQSSLDKRIFRITKKDQMHITLAFLGDVDEKNINNIDKSLKNIKFKPFSINTKSFGFFPANNRIRIVWIGLENNDEFIELQKKVRSIFNFKDKLMPHITVARAKKIIYDKEYLWTKKISQIKIKEKSMIVNNFILYESVPTNEGNIYKILKIYESNDY